MPADTQCYVLCCGYIFRISFFLEKKDKPRIPLSKANIQLYFVNVSLDYGKTGKDRVRCARKCNQAKTIKTPN